MKRSFTRLLVCQCVAMAMVLSLPLMALAARAFSRGGMGRVQPLEASVLPLTARAHVPPVIVPVRPTVPQHADVLVVAPHPDDEILGVAERMQTRLREGKRVVVLLLTNGEAKDIGEYEYSHIYSTQRKAESRRAAQMLGIPGADVLFLNFPDRSLSALQDDSATISPYTYQTRTDIDSYAPNTLYTHGALVSTLAEVLQALQPEEVYITSAEDEHPDHAMAPEYLREALSRLPDYHPAVYAYQIHGRVFTGEPAVREPKASLIDVFITQHHTPENERFLEQYGLYEELFTPLALP
ncbi:PIG-L family deacetylase [Candidatus Peribacteria bacterium]|nr:PIG-L family deacetylase [Candidatus Peribacteria bacterium]